MLMGDTPRKLTGGKWDAAKKTLVFEYESESYGGLTSTATLEAGGTLKGAVRSDPDSDGYPWTATKNKRADA